MSRGPDVISVGSFPGRGMIDSHPLPWEDSLKKVLAMDWQYCGPWGRGT